MEFCEGLLQRSVGAQPHPPSMPRPASTAAGTTPRAMRRVRGADRRCSDSRVGEAELCPSRVRILPRPDIESVRAGSEESPSGRAEVSRSATSLDRRRDPTR
jgi:hypothetical protein